MGKIKSFWMSIIYFFLLTYFSTELLNWNEVAIREIFGNFTTVADKISLFFIAIGNFFIMPKFICGMLLFVFVYLIIYGVTNKAKLSCFLVSAGSVIFGIVNYIVTQARGTALTISDIFSVRTAMNVSDGITIDVELNLILGILIFILALVYLFENKLIKNGEEKTLKKKVKMISRRNRGDYIFLCI